MSLGVILPNSGTPVTRTDLTTAALAAEAAGAASVWVSDHLLMVDRPVSDYPFSADGRPTWSPEADWYEALACCAYLAAVTTRVRIGTATLTLPQRNVLQLAKETATIDQLSDGRLELGVGVGWSKAEMSALGYDYGSRGIRFEEMVSVLRGCWSGCSSAFSGKQIAVEGGLLFHPLPARRQGPPVLVGGMSRAAIRRAATIGDGWLAIAFTDEWNQTILSDGLSRLRELASDAVREPDRDATPRTLLKLHCRDGGYDRLASCLPRAFEMGFDEVLVDLPWALGPDAATEMLSRLLAIGAPT